MEDDLKALEYARDGLKALLKPKTILHTRTIIGRGETDYVKLYVVSRREGQYRIFNATYYAACLMGVKLHPGTGGIPMGGGQYNKGLQVAETVWKAVRREHLDQTNNWEEIS